MSAHTPGPWSVNLYEFTGRAAVVSETMHIASLTAKPETNANARLIAAAPELLEALRYIACEQSGWTFKVDPLEHARSVVEEMRDKARAAIAKAEGRS